MSSGGQQGKAGFSVPAPIERAGSGTRFRGGVGGRQAKTQLSVQGDNTWKKMVEHEKLMIKLWKWKWDFLQEDEETNRNANIIQRKSIDEKLAQEGRRLGLPAYQELEQRNYHIKPSPPIPIRASEVIGWRSGNRQNSFDLYPGVERVRKISFADEQYGRYRKLKYLQSVKGRRKDEPITEVRECESLPSKAIRHVVYPLLC